MKQRPLITLEEYLRAMPESERAEFEAVRARVRRRLPAGYREAMNWGMVCYEVPLARYPDTYNGQPLLYAALGRRKNGFTLALTCAYVDPAQRRRLEDGFRAEGKRLDMGKSCIHFRRADDLAWGAVGEAVAAFSVDRFIQEYERTRAWDAQRRGTGKRRAPGPAARTVGKARGGGEKRGKKAGARGRSGAATAGKKAPTSNF